LKKADDERSALVDAFEFLSYFKSKNKQSI